MCRLILILNINREFFSREQLRRRDTWVLEGHRKSMTYQKFELHRQLKQLLTHDDCEFRQKQVYTAVQAYL